MSLVLHVEKQHPLRPKERYRFAGAGLRVIKIGTLRSAHIPLDESGASRLQATIRLKDGRAYLLAIGRQPVLLNGRQLEEGARTELYSDDNLQIGSTSLSIRLRLSADETPRGVPVRLRRALQDVGDATCEEIVSTIRRRRSPQPKVEACPTTETREEKYDTAFLVAKVRRERRQRGMVTLGVLACLATGLAMLA